MAGSDDMASELWDLFEQESEDFLAQIEENLSGSAEDLKQPAVMGALFRAFHSLKGIAASLGLTGVESIAHRGEDLLELFRGGEAEPDEAARELLLHASDALVSLREACIRQRTDLQADQALLAALSRAKQDLRSGETVQAGLGAEAPAVQPAATPAAEPAPPEPVFAEPVFAEPAIAEPGPANARNLEPELVPEPRAGADGPLDHGSGHVDGEQEQMAAERPLDVSRASADPEEAEFLSTTVDPFTDVVSSELGQLAEALESPALDSLDTQAITSSILAIREAAIEAGYLGIVDVLAGVVEILRDSETLDRTALTRGLCLFVHRLRVLSELAESGLSMDDVDDSMSPHISREARDVVDRLSVAGGAPKDWELVGILARALGVYRISALARLTSELTAIEAWRERGDAVAVAEEIRREAQVTGIEGLTVAALDMRQRDYDRLRDQMALLLTNAAAGVAALRETLGDEIFNSLSPDARNQIADFVEQPGAVLLEIQAKLPDGDAEAQEMLAEIFRQKVMSNRVLVDVDPDLYQFLIGVTGSPAPLVTALQAMSGGSQRLTSWQVLVGDAPAESTGVPVTPQPSPEPSTDARPSTGGSGVLFVDDDAWNDALLRPAAETAAPDDGLPSDPAVAPSPTTPSPTTPPPTAPPPSEPVPESVSSPATQEPSPEVRADEMSVPPDAAPASVAAQATPAPSTPKAPSAPAAESSVPAERSDGAASRSAGGSLRVSSELIDQYLDTVAELRLCLSRLDQGAAEAGFASTTAELRSLATQTGARKAERLRAAAAQIDNAGKVIANQIARAETTLRMLHSVTLDLRVVPISIVLGRMPRLVRDLSRNLGKQVNLDIEDGDIQIDKSMVDALTEPLVHMIRNAMDHGIEGPEERRQAGKPEKATLSLRATQNGSVAQIMIADDGRGLNTAKIRAKAMERGLISDQDAARMSEREIHRQIFAPGFSTASAVTETSGRGVGMDVVLVTMRRLGGSIDIDSVEGEGTRFYLSFPVSAALQRIIVVTDGERDLGLPERAIIEVIEVEESSIQTVGDLAGIQHRDGFLPVRPIETMLGWETPAATAQQLAYPVVIIGSPQRRVGVAVSRVKRRQEVFMKELHPALSAVDVLAGATVMGEGQPLLVLDPETLIAIAGA